jgi:peroxiredoxin
LAQVRGSGTQITDTAVVTNGCFNFSLSRSTLPGMYSIILDKRKNAFIRILFNNENIVFHSDFSKMLESMNFFESNENRLYYEYSKFIANNNRKADLISRLSGLYKNEDTFFISCQDEIKKINLSLTTEPARMISEAPSTFFAHLLKAQQPILVPDNLDDQKRKEFYKEHYLDNIDFNYSPLENTDLLPSVIKTYISFFKEASLTFKDQATSYMEASDKLISKCKMNQSMSDFIIKELIEIFRFGDYDILAANLIEKYFLPKKNASDQEVKYYKTSIESIRRVSVGEAAPEIHFYNSNGISIKLSEFIDDYILVIFWSTNCSHCTEMLPELNNIYALCKDSSIRIIAYSLDTDKKSWNDFILEGNYRWTNFNDSIGSHSKTVLDYNVKGTPSFFLLNKEKIIIAKPVDLNELKEKLMSLKIIRRIP